MNVRTPLCIKPTHLLKKSKRPLDATIIRTPRSIVSRRMGNGTVGRRGCDEGPPATSTHHHLSRQAQAFLFLYFFFTRLFFYFFLFPLFYFLFFIFWKTNRMSSHAPIIPRPSLVKDEQRHKGQSRTGTERPAKREKFAAHLRSPARQNPHRRWSSKNIHQQRRRANTLSRCGWACPWST